MRINVTVSLCTPCIFSKQSKDNKALWKTLIFKFMVCQLPTWELYRGKRLNFVWALVYRLASLRWYILLRPDPRPMKKGQEKNKKGFHLLFFIKNNTRQAKGNYLLNAIDRSTAVLRFSCKTRTRWHRYTGTKLNNDKLIKIDNYRHIWA